MFLLAGCVWIPEAEHEALLASLADEADDCEVLDWHPDADGDGVGSGAAVVTACEAPDGHVADATDCDDDDATLAGPTTWYLDADGDGWGGEASQDACAQPGGYVDRAGDCADTDTAVNPDADEACDGIDNDCDGTTDTGVAGAPTWYADDDTDGFGDAAVPLQACEQPAGHVPDATDCDDTAIAVHPDADETCGGKDEDCDGTTDEDEAIDAAAWYFDDDDDGYGAGEAVVACTAPSDHVDNADDCDDEEAEVNPDASEVCNGIDDDCDTTVDQDALDPATWYADTDADTFGDASSVAMACDAPAGHVADATDCDDTRTGTHPGADEVCGGADEDCDGSTDEDSAIDASEWYADADGDGYGAGVATVSCTAPTDYVGNDEDCDDTLDTISPLATEVCDDGIDDDCSGLADDGCGPVGALTSADADAWLVGAATNLVGSSVAVSDDITGDGAPDLVVTAMDDGLYALSGPSSGSFSKASLPSVAAADRFMVDAGGDYDGDGIGDAMSIGGAGANYLYYGPIDAPSSGGGSAAVSGGMQYAALSDVDGDADADLVYVSSAAVYLDEAPTVGVNGIATGSANLSSVFASGADLTADGIDDFAAGDGTTTVKILDGAEIGAGSVLNDIVVATLTDATSSTFGSDAALLPDADGDGYGDLLVGASGADLSYTDAGAAWLISGPASAMTAISGVSFLGATSSDKAGKSVGTADIDGDALSDVLVGGGITSGANKAWLAYAPFSAGTYELDLADASFSGFKYSELELTGCDLEETGQDTLVIGDSADSSGGGLAGAVWLFHGGGR